MLKDLASRIREYRKEAILTPLLMVGEVFMEVLIPALMANIIDIGVSQGNIPYTVKMSILLIVCAFASMFFGVLGAKTASVASSGFARNLRHDLYYKIEDFSFSNIDSFSTSSLITRLTTDVQNVQMAFQNCLETGFDDVSYTVFTPQLVAVYNFTSVPFVQPYIGAGIGYNINNFSGFDSEVDMANAFSFVTKGGVRYNIPGTTMLVLAYIKYNFNMTELTESYGGESWKADINAGTLSFGLGFGYVF